MSALLSSDGVVAFFLLNDCSLALRYPDERFSKGIVSGLHALLGAAVEAGVPQAYADELLLWLRLNPSCPRALVLAVAIGHAIPDTDIESITDTYLPSPPDDQALAG